MSSKKTKQKSKAQAFRRVKGPSGVARGTGVAGFGSYLAAPANSGFSYRRGRGGMSDVRNHRIEWVMGYAYVGDGTHGAQDSVYFGAGDATTTYPSLIPIAPADATFGQSYAADVMKHYARKNVRSCGVAYLPKFTSTANSCQVQMAPYRGGSLLPVAKTDTTAAPTQANVFGMQDNISFSCFQEAQLDLTKYIAGGSGPTQREFNVGAPAADASGTVAVNSLVVPCGFIVTGTNSNTAFRGANIGTFVGCITLDLLDYLGGQSESNPNIAIRYADGEVRRCALKCSVDYERGEPPHERKAAAPGTSAANRLDADGGDQKRSAPQSARDVQSGPKFVADDVRSIDGRDGMPVQPTVLSRQKGYVVVERPETGTAGRPQSAK